MRPKAYTFRGKLGKYKNTAIKLLASHKQLKAFVSSTAKYLYLKIYPVLNIFLGTEDAAVNKIDRNVCSRGFMLYGGRGWGWGEDRQ